MPSPTGAPARGRRPAVEVEAARLPAPEPRPGSLPRTALVNRLRGSCSYPVVAITAPAGYGKSALLAQWAERDGRPFAWASLADGALPDWPSRASVLVLDGLEASTGKAASAAVATLTARVPTGSTLVLAGRSLPAGPLARLRAAGSLFEVGPADLAFSPRETEQLVRSLGVVPPEVDLSALVERTEGWPAGVHLAALAAKDGHPTAGDDRFVADYFDFELLSGLGEADLDFLTRTSVLETLCGSLCDAVLEEEGSARRLAALERAGAFLVPLDHTRSSYRYHREFRDFLRARLELAEPKLVPVLHRRASAWCEAAGDAEGAIRHAHAAGDRDRLAGLVASHALTAWAEGRGDAVETWLGWFDEGGLKRYPAIALLGARVHMLRGRTAAAERWLAEAERSTAKAKLPDGSRSLESWLAVLHAVTCRDGLEQMQADTETALRTLAPGSFWRPTTLLMSGLAQVLLGNDEAGEIVVTEAAEAAEALPDGSAGPTLVAALAEGALLALARGDEARFEELAARSLELVGSHGLERDLRSAIAFAASARRWLRHGRLDEARADLQRAAALREQLAPAVPWYAVRTSLELASVHLALLDVSGARTWHAHAGEILRRRPALGRLRDRYAEVGAEIEAVAQAQEGRAGALTPAELRLLPLLATHRSFREIGGQLHISRNTVKTQAISVYRKLGVSSRSDAIERAAGLGLLDG